MASVNDHSLAGSLVGLVRLPNLLIVALTQYLLFYLVLEPMLETAGYVPVLGFFNFALLVLTTMLITAAGYVANDLADMEIDKVNKPHKMIVGRRISIGTAVIFRNGLILTGLVISVYLGVSVGKPEWILIYPVAVGGLELYARYLKQTPVIGNAIVSLFCAGVAAIVVFPDWYFYFRKENIPAEVEAGLVVFTGYIAFAFHSTMYREVVKDLEDMEGDRSTGCRTLPLVAGIKFSKFFASLWAIFLLVAFFRLTGVIWQKSPLWSVIFSALFILIPLAYSILKLIKAKSRGDFHHISQVIKLIMVGGLLLLFFY